MTGRAAATGLLMPMTVVHVRQMRMVVKERRVPVHVRVRLDYGALVRVSVVLAVDMGVLVLLGIVHVRVGVTRSCTCAWA